MIIENYKQNIVTYLLPNAKFKIFLGGDVYVLTIQATTHRDSGLYICEIDSTPISKSFHKLTGRSVCYRPLQISL